MKISVNLFNSVLNKVYYYRHIFHNFVLMLVMFFLGSWLQPVAQGPKCFSFPIIIIIIIIRHDESLRS